MLDSGGRSTPARVLSVANQKGGVGKTTTVINLGTALAAVGKRVLLLDLDPQGNASTGLGSDTLKRNVTMYDVLVDQIDLSEAIIQTIVPNLFLVPASVDLSSADVELADDQNRLFLNGQMMQVDALIPAVMQLMTAPNDVVVLRPKSGTQVQSLVKAMTVLRDNGIYTIALVGHRDAP